MKVICRILRQSPGEDPRWAEYHAEVGDGATVLDLLRSISRQDPALAYTAHHCKLGICAGCRMVINGRKRLACRTLVRSPQIRLEPFPGLPVIKDLLVDLLASPKKGVSSGKKEG
jgi:succinate dehydrogenase/fumarate reductase-like Fe-S protein